MRFGLESCANAFNGSMTQVIEKALLRLMAATDLPRPKVLSGESPTAVLADIVSAAWHEEDAIRLIRLGYMAPRLLTEGDRVIFDTFVGATRYFPNGQKGGELSFLGEDDVFAGVVGLSKDYLDHVEKFDLAKCIEHLPSMRENLLFLYENSAIDLDKTTDWFN